MFNNFDESRWEQLEKNWTAWWNNDMERPMLVAQKRKHVPGRVVPQWWKNKWWGMGPAPFENSAEAIAEEAAKDLEEAIPVGDAWPGVWLNFGPGVAAAFLGGVVDIQPQTFWFLPGKWEGKSLREIKPEYIPDEPWWTATKELTAACVARFAGHAQFGFTDLGGNLDVAASLRDTQKLLCDCLDDPEEIGRAHV